MPREQASERSWLPIAIAAGAVLLVAAVVTLTMQHGRKPAAVTPVSAAPDPYAASLPISILVMSESTNLAGGKVTYIDGTITNTGSRTVPASPFRSSSAISPRKSRRTRPTPCSGFAPAIPMWMWSPSPAAPLAPGASHHFRLIFDWRFARLGRRLPGGPHPPRRLPIVAFSFARRPPDFLRSRNFSPFGKNYMIHRSVLSSGRGFAHPSFPLSEQNIKIKKPLR